MNAQRSATTSQSPSLSAFFAVFAVGLLCLCGCQYQSTTATTTNHVYVGAPKAGATLAATTAPAKAKTGKADQSDQSDRTDQGQVPAINITTTVGLTQAKPVEVSPGRELSPARSVEGNTIPVR